MPSSPAVSLPPTGPMSLPPPPPPPPAEPRIVVPIPRPSPRSTPASPSMPTLTTATSTTGAGATPMTTDTLPGVYVSKSVTLRLERNGKFLRSISDDEIGVFAQTRGRWSLDGRMVRLEENVHRHKFRRPAKPPDVYVVPDPFPWSCCCSLQWWEVVRAPSRRLDPALMLFAFTSMENHWLTTGRPSNEVGELLDRELSRFNVLATLASHRTTAKGSAYAVIQWEQRVYLLPTHMARTKLGGEPEAWLRDHVVRFFCRQVALGTEPRRTNAGAHLCRMSDRSPSPAGLPLVPRRFEPWLRDNPIEVTVVAVRQTAPSPFEETEAILNKGRNDGLVEGLSLWSDSDIHPCSVRALSRTQARVDFWGTIRVGDRLSTRPPQRDGP